MLEQTRRSEARAPARGLQSYMNRGLADLTETRCLTGRAKKKGSLDLVLISEKTYLCSAEGKKRLVNLCGRGRWKGGPPRTTSPTIERTCSSDSFRPFSSATRIARSTNRPQACAGGLNPRRIAHLSSSPASGPTAGRLLLSSRATFSARASH